MRPQILYACSLSVISEFLKRFGASTHVIASDNYNSAAVAQVMLAQPHQQQWECSDHNTVQSKALSEPPVPPWPRISSESPSEMDIWLNNLCWIWVTDQDVWLLKVYRKGKSAKLKCGWTVVIETLPVILAHMLIVECRDGFWNKIVM